MKPFAILILAAFLHAVPSKAPTIPDALQARFWKSQVELQRAQQQMQAAQSQYQAVIKEVQAACGTDAHPQFNPQGDLACVENVKASKK